MGIGSFLLDQVKAAGNKPSTAPVMGPPVPPAPTMGPPIPKQDDSPFKSPQELAKYVQGVGATDLQGKSWWDSSPYKKEAWNIIQKDQKQVGPPVPKEIPKEPSGLSSFATNVGRGVKLFDKGLFQGTSYIGSQIEKGFGFAGEETKQKAQAKFENAMRTLEYYFPETPQNVGEKVIYGVGSSTPNLTLTLASSGGLSALAPAAAKTALGKMAISALQIADTGLSFSVPNLLTENRSVKGFAKDFVQGGLFSVAGKALNTIGAAAFGYGSVGQRLLNIQGQGMFNAAQTYMQGGGLEDQLVSYLQGGIMEIGMGTTRKQNIETLNRRISEGVGMEPTDFIQTNGKVNPEAVKNLASTLVDSLQKGTAPGFARFGKDAPVPEDYSPAPQDEPQKKLDFSKAKSPLPEDYGPEADKVLNTRHFQLTDEQRVKLDDNVEQLRGTLEKTSGKPISHTEVIQSAKEAEAFKGIFGREKTLEFEAKLLKARQLLTEEAKKGELTPRLIELSKTVKSYAAFAGRILNVHNVEAVGTEDNIMLRLISKMEDAGANLDQITEKAKGVDFNDQKQAVEFYRSFVKPKMTEILSEFRYANLLSSPKTHIVNAFSNAFQGLVLEPFAKTGDIIADNVGALLTGKDRTRYFSEVPEYYRKALTSLPQAMSEAFNVLRGKRQMTNLDLQHIPTNSTLLKPVQVIPRALEAMDVFFQNIIQGGEKGSMNLAARRQGLPEDTFAINDSAERFAKKALFRGQLDTNNATGQGKLLSGIDAMTSAILEVRKKVPGTGWIVPFVNTPMNILKRGLEYSPAGYATMVGNNRKSAQFVRATLGSLVMAGAGSLAMNGQTTWGIPSDPKEKELFYASGKQPYSIKVGDKWYSYSKLGPVAYPLAMGAAVGYYWNENKTAQTDSTIDKLGHIIGGTIGFFSDQSYVQQVGDLLDAIKGDKKIENIVGNVATQYVPLSSLLRWVDGIVDPVYRKTGKGLAGVLDNIKKGIPGLSESLDTYTDPKGNPSKKAYPLFNAFNPLTVSKDDPSYDKQYQSLLQGKQAKNTLDTSLEEKVTPIKKKAQALRTEVLNGEKTDKQVLSEIRRLPSTERGDVEKEYKKLQKSQKTKDRNATDMEVYPYVQDYINLRKEGKKTEASALFNSLGKDEKKALIRLYDKYKDV